MEHIVSCPQPGCGASADIVDRWVWLSTNGPVEHVKTWCVNGHGFTPILDSLVQPTPSLPEPAVRVLTG
jgi:hypothetical protein